MSVLGAFLVYIAAFLILSGYRWKIKPRLPISKGGAIFFT